MIQYQRTHNIDLFDLCLCLEKRHFKNVGDKINLSEKQTKKAAYSLLDLTKRM